MSPAATVEIWSADLSRFPGPVEHLVERLSEDERDRLESRRGPGVRRLFLLRRAMLRRILCPDRNAASPFDYGPHGKPSLAGPGAPRFNLSHAGGFSVLALWRGGEIGVDVALEEDLPDLDRLVTRAFGRDERARFEELPPSLRLGAFYSAWTQKEALLKALGTGLSLEPDLFAVEVDPRAAPRLRSSLTPLLLPERWELHALSLPSPYRGALALEGGAHATLRYLPFDVLSLA